MRAVGDDALEDARERVQQGGGALGADAVLLGDLLGDRPRHDDGNGVVGGGNVHEAHQQTDAKLTAALSAKHPADEGEDALEAAVGADKAAQRGDQQRHQNGLEHARHAAAHIGHELQRRDLSGDERDGSAGGDADEQHHKHIQAENAADEHQQIGDDEHQIMITGDGALHIRAQGYGDDQHQRRQCGGQGDLEVCAELILHFRALRGAGGDRGVGDEAEVVAEHCAAHDGGDAQRQIKAGVGRNGHGDGGEERDRAHGGTHGHGYEARHHEQHRDRQLHRSDGQQEVGHGLSARASGDAHKDTGDQKDQDHGDNVLVADALSHQHQLFIKAHTAILQACHQQSHQKSNDDGDLIEAHLDFQHIFQNDAQHQVQHQKDGDRQQSDGLRGRFLIHDDHTPLFFWQSMHKHPRKMVTYSVKNVNEETNSPSDEDFSAPAGRPAAGGGAAKRRPMQKPLRTFRSQRLLCFAMLRRAAGH